MKQKLQYYIDIFRERGFYQLVSIIFNRIFYPDKSCRILVALSTPRPATKALESSKEHIFKFATADELRAIQSFPGQTITDEYIDYVARGSARCLLQMDGDKLTGYAWVWMSKLAYIDEGFHLNLPNDTIYNFKAFTAPEYRGFGYQALRHLKLLEMLESEGIKRLFGFVEYRNINSLKGVKKSGYEQVGSLTISQSRGTGKVTMKLQLDNNFWSREART